MIKEIQAKTILARVRGEDDWFGLYQGNGISCQEPKTRGEYHRNRYEE